MEILPWLAHFLQLFAMWCQGSSDILSKSFHDPCTSQADLTSFALRNTYMPAAWSNVPGRIINQYSLRYGNLTSDAIAKAKTLNVRTKSPGTGGLYFGRGGFSGSGSSSSDVELSAPYSIG